VIGIDFDNTIVRYDDQFRQAAVEQGLVTPEIATSKTAIRDHLRASGREDRWTELQGEIYGPRMREATPFPGVGEFFMACRAAGIPVAIVSHRTRYPHLGPRHDLHAAARDWLARRGFHDPAGIGLPLDRVFFEETKDAKLARIADMGCTHFIDDLPELLAHPHFPANVRRILFDPHDQHELPAGIGVAASWPLLLTLLLGSGVEPGEATLPADASSARSSAEPAVSRLTGGGNNRVYRVETDSGPVLLKKYFRHAGDPRDRLGAEQAFSRFAWSRGLRSLPQPLACDREAGVGIYAFVPGRKLAAGEVAAAHVDQAAAFLAALNRHRADPAAARLPIASEACFSLREHVACVDRRLARLTAIEPESPLHRQAADVVGRRLAPTWSRVREAATSGGGPIDAPLAAEDRVISPSDFGFHNCIVTREGLTFVDFEYAGWDDPAKTVCDFFCQPAVPVAREHVERFLAVGMEASGDLAALRGRVALLLPVYEVKWCCIMLNEFLPVSGERRAFAHEDKTSAGHRQSQLRKVEAALDRLQV